MQTITREDIRKLIDRKESFLLVEALPESFYEAGHLPGAIVIPAGYVAEIAPKLISDKKAMVIVYCGSRISQNSLRAIEEFRALGYMNVHHYAGGKEDWTAAGLPLEKGLTADLLPIVID